MPPRLSSKLSSSSPEECVGNTPTPSNHELSFRVEAHTITPLLGNHLYPMPRVVHITLEVPYLLGGLRLGIGPRIPGAGDYLVLARLKIYRGFPEPPSPGFVPFL